MPVDMAEPEEPEDHERLPDDDAPVEALTPEQKRGVGRPRGAGSAAHAESQRLSDQIWEEYAGGMNTQQIADLHGMTRQAVWARIRRLRAKLGIETIEEAKALDLGRYEALIERVWTRTFQEPNPDNVRSLAMLMDQRAKLLGLNAPKQLKVQGQLEVAPSPAMVMVLDRLAEERSRLSASAERPAIEAPDEDVVEAEIVDDTG